MKFLLIWLKVIIEVGIFPPCPPLWVKWLTRSCVLARVALVQNKSSPRVGLDQEGDFRRKRGGVEMLNIIGSIQPPTDRNTGDNNGSCHGIASEFLFWSGEFIKTVRNDFYILWSCLAGVKRDKQFWEDNRNVSLSQIYFQHRMSGPTLSTLTSGLSLSLPIKIRQFL